MKTNVKHQEQLSLGELLRQKLDNTDMNNTFKINSIESGDQAISQRNFIVGSIDVNGMLSFTANPVVHSSQIMARQECKRLAKIYPGKTFLFVQLTGAERTRIEPTAISL